MPWYYAGPEAKPVGPLSLEQLHAARTQGTIKPETYVIEHTGAPATDWSWKRYQDLFQATTPPPVPPVPAAAPYVPPPVPPIATPQPAAAAPHPLFPSAAPVSGQSLPAPAPVSPNPAMARDPYYNTKPTNGWCAWGFGLGLGGFAFSFICGLGLLLAVPSLLLCLVGLVQLRHHPEQGGRALGLWGVGLSLVALVVATIIVLSVAIPMIKSSELTVTEQTSNDSE